MPSAVYLDDLTYNTLIIIIGGKSIHLQIFWKFWTNFHYIWMECLSSDHKDILTGDFGNWASELTNSAKKR